MNLWSWKSFAKAARNSAGHSVLLIDAFQPGAAIVPRDTSARHFLTFNRTDDAHRVQDILTAIAYLKQSGAQTLNLAATGKAAIWSRFDAALSQTPLKLQADAPTSEATTRSFRPASLFREFKEREAGKPRCC